MNGTTGSLGARAMLLAAVGLAMAATAVLVLSESVRWMRLGVVAALWAALVGAFLAARYRKQVADRAEDAAALQKVYELELEREIAARREYELEVEAEAKAKFEAESRDDLAELRAELRSMREHLEMLLGGGEVLVERVALRAEATRMRALAENDKRVLPNTPLRRITAGKPADAQTDMIERVRPEPGRRADFTPHPSEVSDRWFLEGASGQRIDPNWTPSWETGEQPAIRDISTAKRPTNGRTHQVVRGQAPATRDAAGQEQGGERGHAGARGAAARDGQVAGAGVERGMERGHAATRGATARGGQAAATGFEERGRDQVAEPASAAARAAEQPAARQGRGDQRRDQVVAREQAEREQAARQEREQVLARELVEREQAAAARLEQERAAAVRREQAEREQAEREQAAARAAAARQEQERAAAVRLEQERAAAIRREQAEREQAQAREHAEREQAAAAIRAEQVRHGQATAAPVRRPEPQVNGTEGGRRRAPTGVFPPVAAAAAAEGRRAAHAEVSGYHQPVTRDHETAGSRPQAAHRAPTGYHAPVQPVVGRRAAEEDSGGRRRRVEEPDVEQAGSHTEGKSVRELLAAHGAAPSRRRRRKDED
ncbi:DUF6779 domain-containing protein [Actinokineospora sp. HUAS TT18]|uniref:DUF6779 domain-containing protein n=1 Tax=Actinokineospora sp. HUAS TT18 TaxID=3447451 RepID=UPI003F51FA31